MCWRYSCQNGYAILAQAVPLWSKHSQNVPILLFAYGVFKSSGKWDGHCGFLLSDWNGNGHREWLHVTQHNGNRGCAGRGCDRFWVWSQPHKGDPCCTAPRNGEGDGAPGVGPEAGDGCGSFWRQASFWLRPGCFISHEVDSADFGEGDFDDPHGPEHWHFHHWRLGIPGPGPAEALPPSISETSLMGNFALFWMHSAALRGRHPWLPRSRRCTTSRSERPPTQMLKIRHTTQRGGSMSNLKEEDPGTSPQLVCSDCSAPWGQFSKCLLCQGSSPVDLSVTPLSVIEVEGQSWQLRITEAGPTWVPSDTKVTKAAGLVEVGDLGRPPPTAASGAGMELVSFSEQVPASQRLTLQQHVAEFGQDEIFHPDGVRPPTIADKDSTQTAVIFHPKTIQMMRFKADLLATPEDDLTEAAQEPRSARRNSSNNKKLPRWMTSSTPWPPSSRGHKRSRTRLVRSYFAMQIFSSFDPFSNENTKKVESPPHTKRCGQHRRRERRLRPPTRPWTQSSEAAVWPSNPSRWLPSRFGLQNCKRHGRATSSPQPWEHRDRSSLTWRPLSSRTFEWRNWSRTTSPLSPRTALTSPLWYWRIESRIAYFRSRLSGARRRASWASWEGAISSRKVYMSSWVLGNSIIKRSWERGGLLSLISSFIRRYGCLRASMSNCHWGYGKAASLLSSYGVPSQLAQDSVIWGQHLVRFPGQPMRTGGGLPFR